MSNEMDKKLGELLLGKTPEGFVGAEKLPAGDPAFAPAMAAPRISTKAFLVLATALFTGGAGAACEDDYRGTSGSEREAEMKEGVGEVNVLVDGGRVRILGNNQNQMQWVFAEIKRDGELLDSQAQQVQGPFELQLVIGENLQDGDTVEVSDESGQRTIVLFQQKALAETPEG